jgi:NAD(P)H-hydrate epimerase
MIPNRAKIITPFGEAVWRDTFSNLKVNHPRLAKAKCCERSQSTMCLPGISGEQMVEVDRIMVNELKVPIELMMEQAGLCLARLAVALSTHNAPRYHIVAGSGNNGGGGLVAARRLINWNHDVTVIIPKGYTSLREVPMAQLERLQSMGVSPEEDMPSSLPEDTTLLDAYMGYGYGKREDTVTSHVFNSLSNHKRVISLDSPSGLDVTTGVSDSGIKPMATLTIAFVKTGLLSAASQEIGELYVCDIGVPAELYLNRLEINWSDSYDASAIDRLNDVFAADPLAKVHTSSWDNYHCWNV